MAGWSLPMVPVLQVFYFSLFAVTCTAQACYYPDQTLAVDDVPCGSGLYSACCGKNAICLSNNLCMGVKQPFVLSRASCTDKNWKSPSCPNVCISCKSWEQLKPYQMQYTAVLTDCIQLLINQVVVVQLSFSTALGPRACIAATLSPVMERARYAIMARAPFHSIMPPWFRATRALPILGIRLILPHPHRQTCHVVRPPRPCKRALRMMSPLVQESASLSGLLPSPPCYGLCGREDRERRPLSRLSRQWQAIQLSRQWLVIQPLCTIHLVRSTMSTNRWVAGMEPQSPWNWMSTQPVEVKRLYQRGMAWICPEVKANTLLVRLELFWSNYDCFPFSPEEGTLVVKLNVKHNLLSPFHPIWLFYPLITWLGDNGVY